jgi:hypothetical protein
MPGFAIDKGSDIVAVLRILETMKRSVKLPPRQNEGILVLMKVYAAYVLWLIAIVAAGCNSGHGPDSLFVTKAGGAVSAGCVKCHNATSSIAPDPLVTNGTGTYGKHIAHVQNTGIPCEKCHYNYINSPTHMNGHLDTPDPAVLIVYFDATNPAGSWINDTGPSLGSCTSLNCHGPDTLDWYGTGTANFQNCGSCHSFAIGTLRRVTGAQGDFGGNASIVSHHVTTTGDPAREQCLVCHDQSTHTAGTVRLRNADTGSSIIYDPVNPASLEPFCLSCHDADGSQNAFAAGGTPTSPFNDGSTLGVAPYPYAMRIQSSWTSTNGHGPNGNHTTNSKVTCLGTGQPGTGCHGNNGIINAHGSMNQVLAAREFNYNSFGYTYNEADYDLCFNCHSNYPGVTKEDVLGVKFGGILDGAYGLITGPNGSNPPYYTIGLKTHFADHNIPDLPPDFLPYSGSPYNDYRIWGPPNKNLHWFHLGGPTDFRGSGAGTGIVCVNCHDVHGSSNPYGATYSEMGYSHIFPDAINIVGMMTGSAYNATQNTLDGYPTYCAFNCHSVQGPTRAWYYPIVE